MVRYIRIGTKSNTVSFWGPLVVQSFDWMDRERVLVLEPNLDAIEVGINIVRQRAREILKGERLEDFLKHAQVENVEPFGWSRIAKIVIPMRAIDIIYYEEVDLPDLETAIREFKPLEDLLAIALSK